MVLSAGGVCVQSAASPGTTSSAHFAARSKGPSTPSSRGRASVSTRSTSSASRISRAPSRRIALAGSGCGAGSSTRSLAHIGTSTTAVRPPYRCTWYQVLLRASSGMLGYAAPAPGEGMTCTPGPEAGQPAASEAPVSTGMCSCAADFANGSASPGTSLVNCTQLPPRSVPCRVTWR